MVLTVQRARRSGRYRLDGESGEAKGGKGGKRGSRISFFFLLPTMQWMACTYAVNDMHLRTDAMYYVLLHQHWSHRPRYKRTLCLHVIVILFNVEILSLSFLSDDEREERKRIEKGLWKRDYRVIRRYVGSRYACNYLRSVPTLSVSGSLTEYPNTWGWTDNVNFSHGEKHAWLT